MSLRDRLADEMKSALKQRQADRLKVIRLVLAAVKQFDVDNKTQANDSEILAIMAKMLKQRQDSIKQFTDAGRNDLADSEAAEVEIIQTFMPAAATEEEINAEIKTVIADVDANSPKDMGKVMKVLRDKLSGRADMGVVGNLVKQILSA